MNAVQIIKMFNECSIDEVLQQLIASDESDAMGFIPQMP